MELQKERFFEDLKGKYWNQSNLRQCPLSDDQEGITLQSLGGVFIATLFGLILAMITLAIEIMYYKKKQKSLTLVTEVKPLDVTEPTTFAWLSTNIKNKEVHKTLKVKLTNPTKVTPPPSFETATFRGKKIAATATLATAKLKPSVREHGLHFRCDPAEAQSRMCYME